MKKTRSGSESGSKGLRLSMDEDRIYDAEGVRIHVGDEIEMTLVEKRSRRFARVLEVRETGDTIRPATVVVGWNDDQRVDEIAPTVFNNFCRVLVSTGGERVQAAAVPGARREVQPHELRLLFDSGALDPATKCSVCGHALSSCRTVEVDGTDWICGACRAK